MKFLFPVLLLISLNAGCSGSSPNSVQAAGPKGSARESSQGASFAFTVADVEACEKGLAQETALVLAAQEHSNNAKTAAARASATQDQWETNTIPGGATASGLSVDRYRAVRKAVNHVLEMLDYQGKIDGPLELDLEHAAPEMKQRLTADAFGDLDAASAAALRARMGTLVPVWVRYMRLVAVNG